MTEDPESTRLHREEVSEGGAMKVLSHGSEGTRLTPARVYRGTEKSVVAPTHSMCPATPGRFYGHMDPCWCPWAATLGAAGCRYPAEMQPGSRVDQDGKATEVRPALVSAEDLKQAMSKADGLAYDDTHFPSCPRRGSDDLLRGTWHSPVLQFCPAAKEWVVLTLQAL